MKKEDKVAVIEQLSNTLSEYSHFYVADASDLNAEQTSALRRACFEQQIKLMVVKNTLMKKALDQKDADFSQLYPSLKGSSAIMFTNTGNAPAKLIKSFSANNPLKKPVLKAAYVEESFYGADQLETLVSIKSKNELIGDVIALLQSPAKNVISSLQSGANTLHGLLKTLAEK